MMEVLFEEILALATSKNFLRPQKIIKDPKVHICHTWEEAMSYFIFDHDAKKTCYNDFKSHEHGKLIYLKSMNSDKDEVIEYRKKFSKKFDYKNFIKNLPDEIREFSGDVDSDLEGYFWSQYFRIENTIFPMLYEYYKLGLFPCGWKGLHPKGKLVVYHGQVENKTD
ncbi:MAG: hypothetical protein SFU98_06295 [Leptospiraceae bacterium]|nr:hypothetical protein [Leptospiraceae bacterium]